MDTYVFDHKLAGTDKYFGGKGQNTPVWDVPKGKLPPWDHAERPDWGVPKEGLLALPPPKRFLKVGSSMWTSDCIRYTVFRHSEDDKGGEDNVYLSVDKFLPKNGMLRYLFVQYYFRRKVNSMTEDKSGFASLVYNTKKRGLYSIHTEKDFDKKRWFKVVRRIGMSHRHIDMAMPTPSRRNKNLFVNALLKAVEKDLGYVYDECTDFSKRVLALTLQHRCDRPIKGLNDTLIENMGFLSIPETRRNLWYNSACTEETPAAVTSWDEDKEYMAWIKNVVYKFIPTLKKTKSMKKALKKLFGRAYMPLLPQLFNHVNLSDAMGQTCTRFLAEYNDKVQKILQHEITRLVREQRFAHVTELLSEIDTSIHSGVDAHIKTNWANTMVRIKRPISWYTWHDLYRFADTLNIRIRPSKFNNLHEIMARHDALALLAGDSDSKIGLPDEKMIFPDIEHPSDISFKDAQGDKVYYNVTHLRTKVDLQRESDIMGHCVRNYADDCMVGKSCIFSLTDATDGRHVWTVDYRANQGFIYSQAEGPVIKKDTREFGYNDSDRKKPTTDEVNTIMMPLAKKLNRLNESPIPFKVSTMLGLKMMQAWHFIAEAERVSIEGENEEVALDVKIEHTNCVIESLVHLMKLLQGKTHQQVMELVVRYAPWYTADKPHEPLFEDADFLPPEGMAVRAPNPIAVGVPVPPENALPPGVTLINNRDDDDIPF